jgi:FlaA1/EpsC-like NDP-sugar epimerase
LLVERAENALFEIDRELREAWLGADIKPCLADVTDRRRMDQLFADERPHVVFHCAAHKHVPMMEANPCEAIKNNVFGTKTVADAAARYDVQAFVLVSTDKAVNPTSVMGATKRVAELYVQALGAMQVADGTGRHEGTKARRYAGDEFERLESGGATDGGNELANGYFVPSCRRAVVPPGDDIAFSSRTSVSPHSTRFVAVRFGNVLGSSGSVVPIFQRQIAAGGPVTVTHPEMRRFFMTIPEASQLVMQAGAIGGGGEVFVLDMGEPVRILDLATELIRRHGLEPGRDIQIRFSGIRPGEKLYEELAGDDERTLPTAHEKIRVWQLPPADPVEVERGLDLLSAAASADSADQAVAALSACVPEYTPTGRAIPPAAATQPHLRLVLPDVEAA